MGKDLVRALIKTATSGLEVGLTKLWLFLHIISPVFPKGVGSGQETLHLGFEVTLAILG